MARSPEQVASDRRIVIRKAIELLNATDEAQAVKWLAGTGFHDEMKRDPVLLRMWLEAGLEADYLFPAWKAAQQILEAAEASHG